MNIKHLLENIKFGEMEYIDFAGLLFASIEPLSDSHKELAAIFTLLDVKKTSKEARKVIAEFLIIPPSLEKSIQRLSKLSYKNRFAIYMKVYSVLSISPINNVKEGILYKIRAGFRISKKEDKGLRTDFAYMRNKLSTMIFSAIPELCSAFGIKSLGLIGAGAALSGMVSNLALFISLMARITQNTLFFLTGVLLGFWLNRRWSEQVRKETKMKAQIAIVRLQSMIDELNIKLQEIEEISNLAWYKEYYDRIKRKLRDLKEAKKFYENLYETCL